MARVAREKKVLTGMGNQGYYGEGIRRVVEYIRAGAIGNVMETHTILGRNFGGSGGRPAGKPVPAGLHWDEWLGPAPYRDYHDGLHPFNWRSWRQFGTGTIGDMACHNLSTLFWALKIGEVKKFTVECLNTNGRQRGDVSAGQRRALRHARARRHAAGQGLRLRPRRPDARR